MRYQRLLLKMMEQARFRASGTLGDTYIIACKLLAMADMPIVMEHKTKCDYWHGKIREIYDMVPHVRVEFVEEDNPELMRISEGVHEEPLNMEYFPQWSVPTKFNFDMDYAVVQAHAGKPLSKDRELDGLTNTKWFNKEYIEYLIESNDVPIVLLADEEMYNEIGNCINLTKWTTIYEALYLISQAKYFVGFEGMLGFMALSQEIHSTLYYGDRGAIEHRIIGSQWEMYVDEFIQMESKCVTL